MTAKITIVYDRDGDWGGCYLDGKLVQYGHEYSITECALDLAGVEVRQVESRVIMLDPTGNDYRTVHPTLESMDDADARSWGV